MGLLLAYPAILIDLIPDLIAVVGYADGAIIVTAVLRSDVRLAGIDAVRRPWQDGLSAVTPPCTARPPSNPGARSVRER